jgi:hypothetical protein
MLDVLGSSLLLMVEDGSVGSRAVSLEILNRLARLVLYVCRSVWISYVRTPPRQKMMLPFTTVVCP